MSRRARAIGATLILAALSILTIAALRMERHDREPGTVRFKPEIAGSACVQDPAQSGVAAIATRGRSRRAVRVRWLLDTTSPRAAATLSRELRRQGFLVETRVIVSNQVLVTAARTDDSSQRHLDGVARRIQAAANSSAAELTQAESPPGGCQGEYVEAD